MLNIDVALSTFWQFARCWKNGETSKFELSCKNGSLEIHMSAKLGHPDQLHFPPPHPPPPPPPTPAPHVSLKRKSPSQQRRHERRQHEMTEEANHEEEFPNTFGSIEIVSTSADVATFDFKCDQCNNNFSNEEALNTHVINNHNATEIKNTSDNVRLFNCETCDFESVDIAEIEAHIKIHIPLHISLPKPPLKKQDFGAFAHPPFEPTFTHCLL